MVGIVSIGSQLFKTVGLLAVRLDLDKPQLKNREKMSFFNTTFRSENHCFGCHNAK